MYLTFKSFSSRISLVEFIYKSIFIIRINVVGISSPRIPSLFFFLFLFLIKMIILGCDKDSFYRHLYL